MDNRLTKSANPGSFGEIDVGKIRNSRASCTPLRDLAALQYVSIFMEGLGYRIRYPSRDRKNPSNLA